MHTSPLVHKVEQFLRLHGIAPGGSLVAVSGGPDSMALLRALLALRPGPEAGPIVIAHLNHQLRGADSDADEAFVRQHHAALVGPGVELVCERIDVAARARAERDNLESVARRLRYAWLTELAQQRSLSWVATGHTADDQAETVLHRLLRGTGLKGLRGIAPRRVLAPGIEVVRPLLGVSRVEVLAYLDAAHQPFRLDRSNADPRFTRNRIRSQLLPYLAEYYNPAIAQILTRLAEQAEEAYRASEEQARDLLAAAERPRGGGLLYLDRRCLTAAPRHRVREVFRLVWEREGWPMGRMTFAHWDRLAGLVFGDADAVSLPGGISARARSGVLRIEGPIS